MDLVATADKIQRFQVSRMQYKAGDKTEITSNIKENKLSEVQKAIIIITKKKTEKKDGS